MHVKVRVEAGARRERVVKISEDVFAISVREAAQHNAANERIRMIIGMRFGVPLRAVRILKGQRSPTKILSVRL